MKKIITNECEFIENVLNSGKKVSDKDAQFVINTLAKYHKAAGLDNSRIKQILNEFIDKKCSERIQVLRKEKIAIAEKNANRYPLLEISEVPITKPEMEKVKAIQTLRPKTHKSVLQKLAITLLALAKLNLMKGNLEPWVKQSYTELFSIAAVHTKKDDQMYYIADLIDMGLIEDTPRIGVNALKVLFFEDGETEFSITDINQVGKLFEQYLGKKLVRCENCGKMITKSTSNKKYCSKCAKIINAEKAVLRARKKRAEQKASQSTP